MAADLLHPDPNPDSTLSHRRGPWSPGEDKALVRFVYMYGPLNWVKIAQLVARRSPKQCRARYLHLNSAYKPEQDKMTLKELQHLMSALNSYLVDLIDLIPLAPPIVLDDIIITTKYLALLLSVSIRFSVLKVRMESHISSKQRVNGLRRLRSIERILDEEISSSGLTCSISSLLRLWICRQECGLQGESIIAWAVQEERLVTDLLFEIETEIQISEIQTQYRYVSIKQSHLKCCEAKLTNWSGRDTFSKSPHFLDTLRRAYGEPYTIYFLELGGCELISFPAKFSPSVKPFHNSILAPIFGELFRYAAVGLVSLVPLWSCYYSSPAALLSRQSCLVSLL